MAAAGTRRPVARHLDDAAAGQVVRSGAYRAARNLVKILYWDGQGFCLFAKRLEKGRFTWPNTKEGSVTLTPAQLSMLVEGLEWRAPRPTWQPTLAG
jgi:transposase